MEILRAKFRGRDDFMRAYEDATPHGSLFVPTTHSYDTGSDVLVEVACDALPNKVIIRGKVVKWRPATPRLRVRAGATIEFAAEEKDKRRFLLSALAGQFVPPKRKHSRLPVDLPVMLQTHGSQTRVNGTVTEISVGGALFNSEAQFPIDTELTLELTPPGAELPMSIAGRIAYHSPSGNGVRFMYRDGGGARRLRELFRRLRLS